MLNIAVNNFSVMQGPLSVFVDKYIMKANTINPDQYDLGLSYLQYRLPKNPSSGPMQVCFNAMTLVACIFGIVNHNIC